MQSSKTASRRAHSSFRLQKAIFSNNLQAEPQKALFFWFVFFGQDKENELGSGAKPR